MCTGRRNAGAGHRVRRRGPGRPPAGDPEVRAALLGRARELFPHHGFAAVSLRQIANAADTTAAMVHYYFGDKVGLYRAMIAEAIEPVVAHLGAMAAKAEGNERLDVEGLMVTYMRLLAANPWLPALIAHEVLDTGGQPREEFIAQFAGRLAPLFVDAIRRERDSGRLRGDLDPRLAAISAIGLCVFPFVSLPLTGRVLGISLDGENLERLAAHTARLFREGVFARAAESLP